MKKFIVNVSKGMSNTAGAKAKEDVVGILVNEKFELLNVKISDNKLKKFILGNYLWKKELSSVREGDIIVFQYPSYSHWMEKKFIENVKHNNIKTILLIHDLDSLRFYKEDLNSQKIEKNFINCFDVVIVHNRLMEKWMRKNGIHVPLVSLEIFDYLDTIPYQKIEQQMPIVFAGNLEKSSFLMKLNAETSINIFGINPYDTYPKNINYKGAFSPSKLSENLIGSYGLVWDGDSLESCKGITGEYMKYNNPHKVSLYLQLGIPVIIWENAAMASFIKENNLGILINNLSDLDTELQKISIDQYKEIVSNAKNISHKLREGYYVKNAVSKSLKILE